MKGDYLIVDIGSKTTDVVYVQNGLPIESRSITIEKAVVKWMKEIQHDMKIQTGKEIPEHEIMKVMLKEESNLPIVYVELINGMLREKIHFLELELSERGYSLDYINIIYVGGGALMAREQAGNTAFLISYVKRVPEEYFSLNVKITDRQEFHNKMLSVIREEMQSQGMKLVGALLAGIGTVNTPAVRDEIASKETELPEICGELPDELSSVLDLIS